MDHDRWMRNLGKSTSEDSDKPTTLASSLWHTSNGQPAETEASNRYKHDVEQAMAMRRRRPMKDKNQRTELNEDDVKLGLRGLDEADGYVRTGHLERALNLYQLGLDVLIRYLKLPESSSSGWGLDKSTVQARVEVAFNHAEEVKAQLRSKTRGQESILKPPGEPAFQFLSNALGRILAAKPKTVRQSRQSAGGSPATSNTVRTTGANTVRPSTVPSTRHPQQPATRRSATSKTIGTKGARGARPSTTQSATTSASQTPSTAAATSASDELRQTVLTDILVQPTELQKTGWDDIAGLADVKQSLQESAILPLMRPDIFTGLRKPQNILLYGPPGTGKTLLVRAVARESGSSLFVCTASSLTSKWMGEAEKLVRVIFNIAREMAPSLLFIDEMDSLLSSRRSEGEHEASRRLKTEFMVQMDGVTGQEGGSVLVLACTNCPWDVDSAVLRRFQRRLLVPLPDSEARKGLLEHLLTKTGRNNLTKKDVANIVMRTNGFSCSDLTSIASEASFGPIRSLGGMKAISRVAPWDIRPVNAQDFDVALDKATKSVTQAQLKRYDEWQKEQSA